ncbi:MAG: SufE family protein [Gemmatimonadetes bacterium]|nr:SufE family protein [Gemmatimonadota bacterium]
MSAPLPERLARTIDLMEMSPDRADRIELLIDLANRYREVPARIAERPFEESHRVPGCESAAFVWSEPREDGTLDFHFAVENPQGISARALAAALADGLSGAPLDEVAAITDDLVERLFGPELSLGKALGLTGIVAMVRREAVAARARSGESGPAGG